MKDCWPRIGVGAVVVRDNTVLLVLRKYPPFPGYWSIPGGHVEPGESILEAARRELLEETGIEAKPLGVIDIHELIIHEDGVFRHYVILDVLMEYVSGEPRPGSDAADARFFQLPVRDVRVTPATRKLLSRLQTIVSREPFKPARTLCRGNSCT